MNESMLAALGVFVLGITSTIHPCPLTTNIAAISVISGVSAGRQRKKKALIGFSIGYILAFVVLALLLGFSLITIPSLSQILQSVITAFLGPILILAGMVLSQLVNLNRFYNSISLQRNHRLTDGSFLSSLLLGAILALTFCPATAFIFFGVMIPISINYDHSILFPIIYASGALLPIIIISVLIKYSIKLQVFKDQINKWPVISGWILMCLGLYISIDQLYL